MATLTKLFLPVGLVVALVCGCARTASPVSPQPCAIREPSTAASSRYLWGLYQIVIDPQHWKAEVAPDRQGQIHWNTLKWLEQAPCTNCLKIVKIEPSGNGTVLIDIEIKHPFENPNLTGFDVRGIAMFTGSHVFPISALNMPDRTLGDGELVNADGFTTLYNATTQGSGPDGMQGYFKGKLATETPPNALLNGFKRFVSDDPANTRNAFYTGDTVTVTYEIDMPDGPFVFGYAVDASWAPPINKPVIDPISDFPSSANCPEPWKISVSDAPIDGGLTSSGGQAKLTIDVYDWQGKEEMYPVLVECPELFDGEVQAEWKEDSIGFIRYEVVIENVKLAAAGHYVCLVSKEALENDPTGKPWLDLTAYQAYAVTVEGGNLMWAKRAGGAVYDQGCAVAALSDNSVVATGSFRWYATFGKGDPNQTVLIAEELDDVFIARYNPDGTLAWAKRAGGYGEDDGYGVTALMDNSTVVTGYAYGSAMFGEGEPNQTHLPPGGNFIARFNPDGTLAWAKRAGGSYDQLGQGVTALSDNSTVVTGHFYGSTTFGQGEPNQTVLTSAGDEGEYYSDIFIARYNPDGTLAWAKRAGGYHEDKGYGVAALSDNSTVVTGYFIGSATFGEGEPNQIVLTGGFDIFIARYNPDGTLAWAKRAGGLGDARGYAVTALSDNSTVVTGSFFESTTFGEGEPNETVLTPVEYYDVFIARYNPDGTLAWAKHAGGPSVDRGDGVTTLSDNSTVVTGWFYGSATFGEGEPNQAVLTSAGYYDIFIARYNPDGTLAWAKRAGGSDAHGDSGFGVTALSDDSTIVTGGFSGSATFGDGEVNQTVLTSAGWDDIFIARYYP